MQDKQKSKQKRNLYKGKRNTLAIIIENPIDVRWLKGFSKYFYLTLFVRGKFKKNYINWPHPFREKVKIYLLPGNRLLFSLFLLFSLIKRKSEYDAIFVIDNLLGALSANIAKLMTSKPVFVQAGRLPDEYFRCKFIRKKISIFKYFLGTIFLRSLIMINTYLAETNFCSSSYIAKKLKRYSKRTIVLPAYGINLLLYKPVPEKEKREIRKKLELPVNSFLIFYSSRIAPEKDPETLLLAVRELQRMGLNIVVLNLSGQYKEFLDLAQKYDVKVIARPPVNPLSQLPQYYQASDLVIQTSLAEGLGLSPIEALACGVPVIVSNVGGLTEIVKDNITGFVIPQKEKIFLVEKILFVMENRSKVRRMALNAKPYLSRNFSEESVFKEYAVIIKSVVC